MLARFVDETAGIGEAHQHGHDDDEHHAADPLAQHELPAEQQVENDAKLDDKIGRCKQKGEARDQRCTFFEKRAADGCRCIGATGDAAPKTEASAISFTPSRPSA